MSDSDAGHPPVSNDNPIELIVLGNFADKTQLCERLAYGGITQASLFSPSITGVVKRHGKERHIRSIVGVNSGYTFHMFDEIDDFDRVSFLCTCSVDAIMICFPVADDHAESSYRFVKESLVRQIREKFESVMSKALSAFHPHIRKEDVIVPQILLVGVLPHTATSDQLLISQKTIDGLFTTAVGDPKLGMKCIVDCRPPESEGDEQQLQWDHSLNLAFTEILHRNSELVKHNDFLRLHRHSSMDVGKGNSAPSFVGMDLLAKATEAARSQRTREPNLSGSGTGGSKSPARRRRRKARRVRRRRVVRRKKGGSKRKQRAAAAQAAAQAALPPSLAKISISIPEDDLNLNVKIEEEILYDTPAVKKSPPESLGLSSKTRPRRNSEGSIDRSLMPTEMTSWASDWEGSGSLKVLCPIDDTGPPDMDKYPLHHFAYCGDYGEIAELSRQGMDLNAVDTLGRTPLHSAVLGRNANLVRHLLRRREVAGDHPDRKGLTPLTMASLLGQRDMIRMLLASGRAKAQRNAGTIESGFVLPSALASSLRTSNVFFDFEDRCEHFASLLDQRRLDEARDVVHKVNVNCVLMRQQPNSDAVSDPAGPWKEFTPLELAVQCENNLPVITFLVSHHAKVSSKCVSLSLPVYRDMLKKAKLRWDREFMVEELVTIEKRYYGKLGAFVDAVIQPALDKLTTLVPEDEIREVVQLSFRQLTEVYAAQVKIVEILQANLPLLDVWEAPKSAKCTELFSAAPFTPHEVDSGEQGFEWLDHSALMSAFGAYPKSSLQTYLHTLRRVLSLLTDHKSFNSVLQERCDQYLNIALPTMLQEPRTHLFKLESTVQRIFEHIPRSDVELRLKASELLMTLNSMVGLFNETAVRPDLLEALFDKYHQSADAFLGSAAHECLCFRSEGLNYVDVGRENVVLHKSLLKTTYRPRFGPVDIAIFENVIVIGANKELMRFWVKNTKCIWRWMDRSFQLTVYENGDSPTLALDWIIQCPTTLTSIPRAWYELLSAQKSSMMSSEVPMGPPWRHIPHFQDAEEIESHLGDIRESGGIADRLLCCRRKMLQSNRALVDLEKEEIALEAFRASEMEMEGE